MCGILYCDRDDVEERAFLRALDLMQHRGPDAPGRYLSVCGKQLGHNRLKILDLDDRSNQPMLSTVS